MRPSPLTVLLALCVTLWFAACATMAPPLPPSLELPKPPSDLRAVRKGDKVTLTWTIPSATTDRQTVRSVGSTLICRGLQPTLSECGTPVGEAPATKVTPEKKKAATYTDTLGAGLLASGPSSFVTYAIEVLNHDGRGAGLSNPARVSTVPTLPPFSNFAAQVTAQGILLSWAAPTAPERADGVRCKFRIYRRQEGGAQDRVADLDLPRCGGTAAPMPTSSVPAGETAGEGLPTNFLDQTFEWEKTYSYHGSAVSVVGEGKSAIEVEGGDTPEVKVFADDVFPPAVPSGLQAVFSGPGQQPFIDLIWAPVADVDLDGYNVYRHEEGVAPVKLNTQLVKTPAYRDAGVSAGKKYFYSVSAVDVRGNESARSEAASESVP